MRWVKRPPPLPRCGARVGGEQAWLRRARPDGTEYSLPIIVGGKPCGRVAAVSTSKGGSTRHRCITHLND